MSTDPELRFVRGTPSLIQIFIIYFGIPHILDVRISPFAAGVLALAISSGAYVAEVFRSGFSAIPIGQTESALALGMSPSLMMRRIILPQVVRIVVPAINETRAAMVADGTVERLFADIIGFDPSPKEPIRSMLQPQYCGWSGEPAGPRPGQTVTRRVARNRPSAAPREPAFVSPPRIEQHW